MQLVYVFLGNENEKRRKKNFFLLSVVESDLQATNDERRRSLTQEWTKMNQRRKKEEKTTQIQRNRGLEERCNHCHRIDNVVVGMAVMNVCCLRLVETRFHKKRRNCVSPQRLEQISALIMLILFFGKSHCQLKEWANNPFYDGHETLKLASCDGQRK